jgi:hypothetical protein
MQVLIVFGKTEVYFAKLYSIESFSMASTIEELLHCKIIKEANK